MDENKQAAALSVGCVSVHVWQDLVLSLSLLSGNSVTDKLDWTFRLYDLKHDGVISREELLDIVTSIYDLLGDSSEPPVLPITAQQHADSVFQVKLNHSHSSSSIAIGLADRENEKFTFSNRAFTQTGMQTGCKRVSVAFTQDD